MHEQRCGGQSRSKEDDGGAGKPIPSRSAPWSQGRDQGHSAPYSLFPIPYSLLFHGSSLSVCRVCAATAAGVKGSAKVVPSYQSFHWSR